MELGLLGETGEFCPSWGLLGWNRLLGLIVGMPDMRRLTEVGSAEGRRSLVSPDLAPPADGVWSPTGSTGFCARLSTLQADISLLGFSIRGASGDETTTSDPSLRLQVGVAATTALGLGRPLTALTGWAVPGRPEVREADLISGLTPVVRF